MSERRRSFGRIGAGLTASAVVAASVLAGALPASAIPFGSPKLAVIATISSGGPATGLAVDAANHTLYALEPGRGSSRLVSLDTTTNAEVGALALPDFPQSIAIDPARGYVYVTISDLSTSSSSLWVVSTATKARVATIALGAQLLPGAAGDSGIVVDPATGTVRVAWMTPNFGMSPAEAVLTAAQITAAVGGATVTPTVAHAASTTQQAVGVGVDSTGGVAYLAAAGLSGSSLYAFDAASDALTATVPLAGIPNTLAVDSSTGTVYVSQRVGAGYSIAVVPRGAGAASATIALPAQAQALRVDPGTGTLYAAVSQPFEGGTVNELIAISTGSLAVLASAPLLTPAGLAADDATNTAYVSGAAGSSASITALRMMNVSRVAGRDRYSTSVAVSQREFPGTAPVVYIASGANYPDALSAGPAAAKSGGPLLLSTPTALTGDVVAEVQRLKPSRIVVVGGVASVSNAVIGQLTSAAPDATVTRVAGDDRFLTSRAVVSGAFSTASTVYLASGSNFPDALSAGAAAGAKGAPILLVDGAAGSVDPATAALLTTLKAKNVELVGGTAAVSAGVASSLTQAGYAVSRLAGSDRYATALAVNGNAYSHASTAVIATGFGFPDALSATSWAGTTSSPLYLAPGSCVPRGVLSDLGRLGVAAVTLIGGPVVLTSSVESLAPCAW